MVYYNYYTDGNVLHDSWYFFTFVEYLNKLIYAMVHQCEAGAEEEAPACNIPDPLCHQYERPDKETAVCQHRSRFLINN